MEYSWNVPRYNNGKVERRQSGNVDKEWMKRLCERRMHREKIKEAKKTE